MESSSVRCHGKVPTPLALAQEVENGFHFGFGCTLIPCEFSLDVCGSQFVFYAVTYLVALALTFVHVLPKRFCTLTVTGLAGAVDVGQGAHDVVVGVFHAAFAHVRHVAIGTRNATLTMNTHLMDFVSGVLCFEDGCTA